MRRDEGILAEQAQNDVETVAKSQRSAVILPAGAGKTELIARSVKLNSQRGGRQLILTHTHAGIAALKERLRSQEIPPSSYRLYTLDGIALRFTRHYPLLSKTATLEPRSSQEWEEIRLGATQALRSRHLRRVVRESYSGLYVDEYQDCSSSQHELVLRLAEEIPCRILGDPLQAVFGFAGVVDWPSQVLTEFKRIYVSETPWRWLKKNPDLGARLLKIRQNLLKGQPFFIGQNDVIDWHYSSPANQFRSCINAANKDRVVAIHKWPSQCHALAKQLGGSFSSMEELAGKDLLRVANDIDSAHEHEIAVLFINFIKECATKLPSGITAASKTLQRGARVSTRANRKNLELYVAMNTLADSYQPANMLAIMNAIERLSDSFIHRRECWYEMKRAIRILNTEENATSLSDAVLRVRDRTRHMGRVPAKRVVSRTLLVKGLEYDHTIIVDADQLEDPRELYVALTRGRYSLVVHSDSRRFQRPPCAEFLC